MANPKPSDICQVRCFKAELVAQAKQALPGDKLLEEAQVLFGALADRFCKVSREGAVTIVAANATGTISHVLSAVQRDLARTFIHFANDRRCCTVRYN